MDIKYREHLWQLFPKVEEAVCVEIGVAEGQFSRDILNWGVKKLYSVDTWATLNGQRGDGGNDQAWHDMNYQNTKNLLAKFGDKSELLRGLSHEMAARVDDNYIDLLYLDGDHSYDGVMRDLTAWYPKLKSGCICAGHDYLMQHYGVQRAVKDFTTNNKVFEVHTIFENKNEDAGFWFRKL